MTQASGESWPEDCPPDTAVGIDGGYYRLVRTDPPTASDFLSPQEENPGRNFKPNQACIKHAVSLHAELEDSLQTRDTFPPLSDRLVAYGELTPAFGVCLGSSRDSHHSWWRTDADPAPRFAVVEDRAEVDGNG